jgi:signal transduction histidine kinase
MSADALGNLAHELRTPIQVMLGLLDILQDEYADQIGEKPRALLECMNVNAFELGQTLDNLMTFVLAKEGNPNCVDEDLSIESLLADIGPTLDEANRGKGLKLCFDFNQAPTVIRTPRRIITSTIVNLALNAVKFTEAGTVTIKIREGRQSEGGPAIEIQVSDTGPGLSPALLDQVSQPFAQLSDASVRRYRGIGLGLAIVRQKSRCSKADSICAPRPGVGPPSLCAFRCEAWSRVPPSIRAASSIRFRFLLPSHSLAGSRLADFHARK